METEPMKHSERDGESDRKSDRDRRKVVLWQEKLAVDEHWLWKRELIFFDSCVLKLRKKTRQKIGANLNVCKINDVKMRNINWSQAFKNT